MTTPNAPAPSDASAGTTGHLEDEITIPDSPAALEELLNDEKKMRKVYGNGAKLAELTRKYAQNVLNKDLDIMAQVKEQTQQFLAQWARDQDDSGVAMPPVNLGAPTGRYEDDRLDMKAGLFNPDALGAKLDKEFHGAGSIKDFFALCWKDQSRQTSPTEAAQIHRIRNAFGSDVPSEGGFLIPENLRSELLRVTLETAIVRPRARVIPMDTLRVPFPAIDESSHASSLFGGIVTAWTEEGASLTDSSPKFGRVVLDAKKLTAYTAVPNELVTDSIISFQPFINEIFPEAMGFEEDYGFLRGTGVGQPLGVLNGSGVISVTENAANNIKFEDVIAMYARMLPGSLGRAVWVASINAFPQLASMVVGTAGTSPAVWLTGGQVIQGPPMSLFGRPVFFTEKVPALGATGALSFIDFSYYLLGDRQAMSVSTSEHFLFGSDKIAFKVIERVDGRPWLNSAITPRNSGDTLSPYVTLLSA